MPSSDNSVSGLARRIGGRLIGDPHVVLSDLTHDSRQAGPGVLFVAVKGFHSDGHDFVGAAVEAGSPAIVTERVIEISVPQIVVPDTRKALGAIAAAVFGDPSREVPVIGITGTNGKTTVTYMLEAIARAGGDISGVIGTVATRIGGESVPSSRTTPEAPDLQRLLRRMVTAGAKAVFVEVSSHALTLGRVDGVSFEISGFTNLSQDHLDFHSDLEEYFEAKASLFESSRSRRSVVNVDDQAGRRLVDRSAIPVTTVGFSYPAQLVGEVIDLGIDHCEVRVSGAEQGWFRVSLGGRFNADNGLLAAGVARQLGYGWDVIEAGLADVSVPGRFEVVGKGPYGTVLVDYAHSPDGIASAIGSARALSPKHLIVVFGAGGDRDKSKRPLMGLAASEADRLIVTSDNPRSEDPGAIIRDVMSGIPSDKSVVTIQDRREAIATAVDEAREDDIVLILGKGHETGQEIDGVIHPFDDRQVVVEELARRMNG